MISKFRTSSIYTPNSKKQLSIQINQLYSYANGQNPFQITSRIGALMPEFDYPNAQLSHSFCSRVLKICANYWFLCESKQIHGHVIKMGFFQELSLQNQVLHVYVKCGEVMDVDKVFDEMPVRNIVSWNIVAKCAVLSVELGFRYFKRMLMGNVRPDSTTMNVLIRSCNDFNEFGLGRQLHCFAVKVGLNLDRYVGCGIVDLCGRFGLVRDAKCAFDEIEFRDLVSWNVMVSSYVYNRLAADAFGVFREMHVAGVQGDEYTFASLLSCCSASGCCQLGKQIQALGIKLSFDLDMQVASVLVDMYAKNGKIYEARKVFDGMGFRNLVTWTTMLVGYGQHGHGKQAMELFAEMCRRRVCPDELTVSSIVSSCGNLAAIGEATQVHAYAAKGGYLVYLSVANALIAAYSNCGCLSSANQCFNSVPEPDIVTLTSILSAHAFHGHFKESINTFQMMLRSGVGPDSLAFLGILSACNHGGLVKEGLHFFRLMTTEFDIVPSSEHYACIVDLLGRSGLVDEASSILTSDSVALESNTLGALIGVSKSHGHFKLAEWAAGKLFELEPNNSVNYTLMSNMYASAGQWNDAAKVRKLMKHNTNSRVPGCSWIEIAGKVHTFLCRDTSHPLALDIYDMLGMLIRPMKEDGCVVSQLRDQA